MLLSSLVNSFCDTQTYQIESITLKDTLRHSVTALNHRLGIFQFYSVYPFSMRQPILGTTWLVVKLVGDAPAEGSGQSVALESRPVLASDNRHGCVRTHVVPDAPIKMCHSPVPTRLSRITANVCISVHVRERHTGGLRKNKKGGVWGCARARGKGQVQRHINLLSLDLNAHREDENEKPESHKQSSNNKNTARTCVCSQTGIEQ